jgi:hypothetical protein
MRRSVVLIAVGIFALLGMHGVAAAGHTGACAGTVAGHHAAQDAPTDVSTAGFTFTTEHSAPALACLAILIGFVLLTQRRFTVVPIRDLALDPVAPHRNQHGSRGPPDRSELSVWRT